MTIQKGGQAANIPFGEGFGHAAARHLIRLVVNDGGRRDHITAVRQAGRCPALFDCRDEDAVAA